MHYLRISKDQKKQLQMAQTIKKTGLYDKKLKMYNVSQYDLAAQLREYFIPQELFHIPSHFHRTLLNIQ